MRSFRNLSTRRRSLPTASSEKSSTSILLDNLQKIIQIFAVIVGGLWALREFYAFQDRNNALTLEQQQAGLKQAELTTRQLELTLQQADIVKEQQKLAVENARLSNEGQKLTNHISETKIQQQEDPRYAIALEHEIAELRRYGDGTGLYYVTVSAEVKNTSEQSIEVSGCVFSIYVGHTSASKLEAGKAYMINSPAGVFSEQRPGQVEWKRLSASARSWNPGDTGWLFGSKVSFPRDQVLQGGCSGQPSAGDKVEYAEAFLLRAAPEDLIGYAVDVVFERFGFYRWRSRSELLGVAATERQKKIADSRGTRTAP